MQVFCRPQKLMICVSSDSTLKLIETLGFDHDKGVLEWRDHLYQRLGQEIPEVSTSEPIMLMLRTCIQHKYVEFMQNMVLYDPHDWSCGNGTEDCFSGHHSSDEELQFSPPACTTPSLMYHTPEAPPFSPLSSTSLATLPRSPESMSISSQSLFGH